MLKKKWIFFILIIILTGGLTYVGFLIYQNSIIIPFEYTIQNAFPNLSFTHPVGFYDSGDDSNRIFVVEQEGKILVFENNESISNTHNFLDLGDKISTGGEKGLLGLAFHPNYNQTGYFYVYYIQIITENSILSRFKVNSTDFNKGNKSSEEIILTIPQPFANHNGGQIVFGPDGYLYIGLGDGGGSGDPDGNGQNRQTLLGSILRIDVDSTFPYSIPNDNPFFGNVNGWKEEIYAFGLRNPWRFSFDSLTGLLWVGDVGQNAWEEIDIIENGNNYGWNVKEGTHDFNPGTNTTSIVDPIYEYSHLVGGSITGGFVYRGNRLSGLVGRYVYADFISGRIWSLDYSGGVLNSELVDSNLQISSFGVDANDELYICAFDGKIYELIEI